MNTEETAETTPKIASDEEIAAHIAATEKREREGHYCWFLGALPDDYRETSDSIATPWEKLPALFEEHKACGALSFPVNVHAFRKALKSPIAPAYFFGPTGTGKTRAALRRAGIGILSGEIDKVNFVRFGEVTREYSKNGPAAFSMLKLRRRTLLILDDFLNGQTIGARKEAIAGDLFDWIEEVAATRATCIITSNAGPEKVTAWFGNAGIDSAAVVRRLGQLFRITDFEPEKDSRRSGDQVYR